MKVFNECAICQFWTSQVKKWTDGNYYCPIHYKNKQDEVISKARVKKCDKNLEHFRNIISGTVEGHEA